MILHRAFILAGLSVSALAGANPTQAADAPSPLQIRKFLSDYGTCIVKREPELARKSILTNVDFSTRSDEGKRLLQRECIDAEELRNTTGGFAGRLRMGDDSYRGVIAEALLAQGKVSLPETGLKAIPELAYDMPRPLRTLYSDGKPIPEEKLARQRAAIERKIAQMALGKLGECVVRNAPAASRAVVSTGIETPGELQSLNALAPALQQCIPAGQTLSFDRMSLRGSLAIAYYRLASAVQTTGAAQ